LTLAVGTRLGPYEVAAELGAGGMGVVYRATDSNLGRSVALKVLPEAFAADPERLARFEREARLLAALNHPNIAQIHGLEVAGETRALVMELVEGPTLAERLLAGPLALEDALAIARQIAEALEAAHEKGIVHRDLKPANVKLTRDGTVKVLDFGLAKALDPGVPGGAAPDITHSPTLAVAPTQLGMILGTAAYMSPEQARGGVVDKRADIWAFGVVLWETLAGRRLFEGDTASDVLAAVLRQEIDWTALPPATPAAIRRLLRRCLERQPKNRLHDIADARLVLDEVIAGKVEEERPEPAMPPRRPSLAWALAAAALVAGLLLGWIGSRLGRGRETAAGPRAARLEFEIHPPPGTGLVSGLAVSPDGRHLAFVARGADGTTELWVRPLDSVEARRLPGSDDARYPFWAPDGKRLGFFAQGRLKVADLLSGAPRTVARTSVNTDVRGAAWGADDTIVYAPAYAAPLQRTTAVGGEPEAASRILPEDGIGTHRWPAFLPDGRRFVFYGSAGSGIEPGFLFVGELGSLDVERLVESNSLAVVAGEDRLVFVRGTALFAQAFDPRTGELVGEPVALDIALPGNVAVSGSRSLSASRNGVLAYRADKASHTRLTWVDREGRELGTIGDTEKVWYYAPRLSPDGRRLAVSHYEAGFTTGDVWIHDLVRGVPTRASFDDVEDESVALWSPDGRELIVQSIGSNGAGLFRVDADSPDRRSSWLPAGSQAGNTTPDAWAPDGRGVLFEINASAGDVDLWLAPRPGEGEPMALLTEAHSEYGADVSPEGRWLAYVSDATQRPEVYVRAFAGQGGTTRLSTEGGTAPRWRSDGEELFYLDGRGRIVAVPVEAGQTFSAGEPQVLFDAQLEDATDRQYDVTADGERFVLNRRVASGADLPIHVIVGWEPPAAER
jgi:Tol biopolymer transport system component